jgi:hypothetical protein
MLVPKPKNAFQSPGVHQGIALGEEPIVREMLVMP